MKFPKMQPFAAFSMRSRRQTRTMNQGALDRRHNPTLRKLYSLYNKNRIFILLKDHQATKRLRQGDAAAHATPTTPAFGATVANWQPLNKKYFP
ncbi:hypothetical protein [Marinobacterium rhizophilum]|uniref:Uncharacterized protein n=1 Tax=Marinobacterium rhizophilum TaxID=420402 RepID=A0ABY5HN82_9GAMM|nr:hypothetical protein [Marinobacterium rhizophilum]UTW12724.1 hypothetical protein KDW95_03325 [Marinobacterium rhizophilum]